jgi:hypothetical protein
VKTANTHCPRVRGSLGRAVTGFLLLAASLTATDLKPPTVQAFDDYIRRVESRLDQEVKSPTFLWADQDPERSKQLRDGQVLAVSLTGKNAMTVPDGLIHDWIGAVFIPGATVEKTLAMVEDYNHHKDIYKPEVIDSKLLSHTGNDFKIQLRLLKKKVITVVLETDYDVRYTQLDKARWYSRSYSTRIQEVDNAGKSSERLQPVGKDHGFLWRLYSYWRFVERDGGVYMECQAISLTRDIPTGLGWMIEPIVRQLPKESLVNTLSKTRDALAPQR